MHSTNFLRIIQISLATAIGMPDYTITEFNFRVGSNLTLCCISVTVDEYWMLAFASSERPARPLQWQLTESDCPVKERRAFPRGLWIDKYSWALPIVTKDHRLNGWQLRTVQLQDQFCRRLRIRLSYVQLPDQLTGSLIPCMRIL